MAGELINVDGTELILESAGSSSAISDGSFIECDSDDRQPSDNAGFPTGRFEFDTAAGGFSGAPSAGAYLALYEQTINSDGVDSPDPDANNRENRIGTFSIKLTDTAQYWVTKDLPINLTGGKYWLEWVDGYGGSVSITAGWELRLIPTTIGVAV